MVPRSPARTGADGDAAGRPLNPTSPSRPVPGNIPFDPSSFVGREQESEDLVRLLTTSRLVTLTGTGGVGKTRLALHVARDAAADFADGAWLVSLAPISEPALVWQATASALDLREQSGSGVAGTLLAHLKGRRLLIVLDNCEHVIDACAQLADRVLKACPDISMLATSREPLAVGGETAWRVPSLSLPHPAAADPEALAASGAVRLFVDRATATRPDFALTPEVAPAVAEICRRLDGIPLGIELAAARVAMLSPAQIAERLDDRFRFLTGGSRTALPRQQTLLATVEWGHDLLTDPERVLLRRLSVFVGGAALPAIEAVCPGGAVERDEVFDLLARLASKSLVVADTAGGEARYRLLETIREFAKDRLREAGETSEWRMRHLSWCLRLAEAAELQLTGAHQQEWLERLDAEHGNLRAGLEWAIEAQEADRALRLGGALTLFWRVRGRFTEGREWLEDAIALSRAAPERVPAKALWGCALLTHMLEDHRAAVPLAESSLSLSREAEDTGGAARSLLVLGNCWRYLGEVDRSIALLEESVALARQSGDRWCLATALAMSGWAHVSNNDLPAARPLFEECLGVAREANDRQSLARGLEGLGFVVLRQGDYGSAERILKDALSLAEELGETYTTVAALNYLGELALHRGCYDEARERLEEALAGGRALGSPSAIVGPLEALGTLAEDEGRPEAAHRHFEEVLAVTGQSGSTSSAALRHLGEIHHQRGDQALAKDLLDQALAAADRGGKRWSTALALASAGRLAAADGDHRRAASLLHEALTVQAEIGDRPGIVDSLEALAGLAAARGVADRAARLFGAAQALRDTHGYARSPARRPDFEAGLATARDSLPPGEFEAAWAEGAALPLEEAISYASRARGSRQRASSGWESLTGAEREVVSLVIEGLNNRQIGERLFVSRATVKVHLTHAFAKLGVANRLELVQQAARREVECG